MARWGAPGVPRGAKWGQWAPKCLPNASQNSSKKCLLLPAPPEDHQNHYLAPKRLQNRRKIDVQAPPVHVEKFALVAPLRAPPRRNVRGPRGQNCDSGALQRTASQVCPQPSWKKLRWWRPSEASITGASEALVEKIAIVAPFRGQSRRSVRGRRGNFCARGALQRPASQASPRSTHPQKDPRARRTGRSPTG